RGVAGRDPLDRSEVRPHLVRVEPGPEGGEPRLVEPGARGEVVERPAENEHADVHPLAALDPWHEPVNRIRERATAHDPPPPPRPAAPRAAATGSRRTRPHPAPRAIPPAPRPRRPRAARASPAARGARRPPRSSRRTEAARARRSAGTASARAPP